MKNSVWKENSFYIQLKRKTGMSTIRAPSIGSLNIMPTQLWLVFGDLFANSLVVMVSKSWLELFLPKTDDPDDMMGKNKCWAWNTSYRYPSPAKGCFPSTYCHGNSCYGLEKRQRLRIGYYGSSHFSLWSWEFWKGRKYAGNRMLPLTCFHVRFLQRLRLLNTFPATDCEQQRSQAILRSVVTYKSIDIRIDNHSIIHWWLF